MNRGLVKEIKKRIEELRHLQIDLHQDSERVLELHERALKRGDWKLVDRYWEIFTELRGAYDAVKCFEDRLEMRV